jgi:hypothetical protein
MNYYFLVASLPMLALGAAPAIHEDEFLQRCREQLTPDDLATLLDLWDREGAAARHPFTRGWRDLDAQVRNAVARERGPRVGRDPQPHLRPAEGLDVRLRTRVQDAFTRPTPLEREQELERLRWALADELAGLNPFALDAVLAYALKLKSAWHWTRLDPEAGRRRVEDFVSQAAAAVEGQWL